MLISPYRYFNLYNFIEFMITKQIINGRYHFVYVIKTLEIITQKGTYNIYTLQKLHTT